MNTSANKNNRKKIIFMAQFSLLLALEAVFCFTPLGSIPVTPLIVATLGMIPVIIAALLLGTLAGSLMGLAAGIFSLIVWTYMPPASFLIVIFSPAVSGSFWSVVLCIVPRILVGTVTALVYKLVSKIKKGNKILDVIAYGVSAALGSLVNTALVLWGGYIIFYDQLTAVFDGNTAIADWIKGAQAVIGGEYSPESAVMTAMNILTLTNGIPEAIVSLIVGYGVCLPLRRILLKQKLI